MKEIFIDSESKCHVKNETGTYISVETDFFDGKCDTYIEGYKCVPEGESGRKVFTPWKDWQFLETAQKLYEEMTASAIKEERILALEDAKTALQEENAMLLECVLEMSEIVYA